MIGNSEEFGALQTVKLRNTSPADHSNRYPKAYANILLSTGY